MLLVEDQTDLREAIHDVLVDCGYTVLVATSAADAIAIGERHPRTIDILVATS